MVIRKLTVFKYQGKYLGEEINPYNGKVLYFDLSNLKFRHKKPLKFYVEFVDNKPTHAQKVLPIKLSKVTIKNTLREIKKLFKKGLI